MKPKFRHAMPHSTARPEPSSGRYHSWSATSRLKCRCDYFQVLSRRLAFDILDEPGSTRLAACIKRCGFISLNTLQGRSQGVLVLSGRAHRQRAETDNSHSNQHCCEYTYGGLSVDNMHKSASTGSLNNCQVQIFLSNQEKVLGKTPEWFFTCKILSREKQNRDDTGVWTAAQNVCWKIRGRTQI
jgi:hypothetical protein